MRILIQRVKSAQVEVEGQVIGKIGKGFLVFIGIKETDNQQIADRMIKKIVDLRIFEDEEGKTNRSLADVAGELLLVSQFTLYADCKKGNRPSFIHAGGPDMAEPLYEYMIQECKKKVGHVATGEFGADMKVSLLNDGAFTIWMDSQEMWAE